MLYIKVWLCWGADYWISAKKSEKAQRTLKSRFDRSSLWARSYRGRYFARHKAEMNDLEYLKTKLTGALVNTRYSCLGATRLYGFLNGLKFVIEGQQWSTSTVRRITTHRQFSLKCSICKCTSPRICGETNGVLRAQFESCRDKDFEIQCYI